MAQLPEPSEDAVEAADDGHDGSTLRTLDRGLRVLEILAAAPSGLTFSEVLTRVGLSTGTINRLLQTLVRRGYVEQDKRSRTYRLGLMVLELQATNLASNRVAAEARPHLRTLQVQTGQRVHLAVYRGGDHVVYIDRVDNEASIGTFVPVGRGGPVHATSLGKAILAFSPRDVVDTYLAQSKRKQLTARTIVDASEIRRQLELVRSRGYATEMSESAEDICCIGAPIFDYTGQVVAAVSISGSVEEVAPNMDAFARSVTEQASTISESFGYRASPVAARAI